LRVAICDDCNNCLAHIERVLMKRRDLVCEYESFTSGKELLQSISENEIRFDLYLLDIEMPGLNGIELAKEIRKMDISALIVYQTSHSGYMEEALDTVLFHYILKPIAEVKLEELIKKAHTYLEKTGKRFRFLYQKSICNIPCRDIFYFEKDKRKVTINTATGIYETYSNMKDILNRLQDEIFLEVSCSHIVNMEYVKLIRKNEVVLYDGTVFSIGRTKLKKVREKQLFLYCR